MQTKLISTICAAFAALIMTSAGAFAGEPANFTFHFSGEFGEQYSFSMPDGYRVADIPEDVIAEECRHDMYFGGKDYRPDKFAHAKSDWVYEFEMVIPLCPANGGKPIVHRLPDGTVTVAWWIIIDFAKGRQLYFDPGIDDVRLAEECTRPNHKGGPHGCRYAVGYNPAEAQPGLGGTSLNSAMQAPIPHNRTKAIDTTRKHVETGGLQDCNGNPLAEPAGFEVVKTYPGNAKPQMVCPATAAARRDNNAPTTVNVVMDGWGFEYCRRTRTEWVCGYGS